MLSEKRLGKYSVSRVQLGEGSFAKVFKGYNVDTKNTVAVKIVKKLSPGKGKWLLSEIALLRTLRHPNIVRLLDIEDTEKYTYIFLEYCAGGDLGQYIRSHGPLPESCVRDLLLQLVAGLQKLHEHNIVHRDLKPQNILLESATDPLRRLLIADFGFAVELQPPQLADTLCGSPLYMAPEVMQKRQYNGRADLWSVGVIMYELLFGNTPYTGHSPAQILHNISTSKQLSLDRDPPLSSTCSSLLLRLLESEPVRRCSYEELFAHPFLRPRTPSPTPHPSQSRITLCRSDFLVINAPSPPVPPPTSPPLPASPAPDAAPPDLPNDWFWVCRPQHPPHHADVAYRVDGSFIIIDLNDFGTNPDPAIVAWVDRRMRS